MEAVKNYEQPENRLQLQRFLNLVNYFRRFIKGFAVKAQNLLKKDAEFKFEKTERMHYRPRRDFAPEASKTS